MDAKQPVYSEEAEQATLGALIADARKLPVVMMYLKPGDFYFKRHEYIYTALIELHQDNQPVDYLTLSTRLKQKQQLELVTQAYITQLITSAPNSQHAEVYARLVESASVRRALTLAGMRMMEYANDENKPLRDVVTDSEVEFENARKRIGGGQRKSGKEVNHAYLDKILDNAKHDPESVTGIPSGLHALDALTNGYEDGELVIMAGRPGMGKSAVALQSAWNACQNGHKTMLFSLEMGTEQLIARLIATMTGIPIMRQKRGQFLPSDASRIVEASKRIDDVIDKTLFIYDAPGVSPLEVKGELKLAQATHGIDLVVVDYLQIMGDDGMYPNNKTHSIGYITQELKNLARGMNIPIVLLSQLNRGLEARQNKRPMLSDLRDSGQIEQDADKVLFLYRDDYYYADSNQPNVLEINVAKNRQGQSGVAEVYWDAVRVSPRNGVKRTVSLNHSE